jgi:hypothetical protein
VAIAAVVGIVVITPDEDQVQVQTTEVTSGPMTRILVNGTLEDRSAWRP